MRSLGVGLLGLLLLACPGEVVPLGADCSNPSSMPWVEGPVCEEGNCEVTRSLSGTGQYDEYTCAVPCTWQADGGVTCSNGCICASNRYCIGFSDGGTNAYAACRP